MSCEHNAVQWLTMAAVLLSLSWNGGLMVRTQSIFNGSLPHPAHSSRSQSHLKSGTCTRCASHQLGKPFQIDGAAGRFHPDLFPTHYHPGLSQHVKAKSHCVDSNLALLSPIASSSLPSSKCSRALVALRTTCHCFSPTVQSRSQLATCPGELDSGWPTDGT